MLFQSYFSMVFKPIHPAKLVTTSLFSQSRVEPIAGPKNHPEIGQHFRCIYIYVYIYLYIYICIYIYIFLFISLCNCYDIPISMDCWENRTSGNPWNFPKHLDLFLFPRSRAISWPCQSAVEDTPERSVAPFRVGHFKAWRSELK